MEKFEVCFLGAGSGGYVGAIRAAQLGARTAVIEEREVGGTCLNRGCIPTKAMLASAKVHWYIQNSSNFGLKATPPEVNFADVAARKDKIVQVLRRGVEGLLKKRGVSLIRGRGILSGQREISVTVDGKEEKIQAERIVIATGSEAARPAALRIDGASIITSDEAVNLTEIPGSILIIGAGAIGCEFAGIFRQFGSDVIMVEMLERVLPMMDADISQEMLRNFKKSKIKVFLGTKVQELKPGNGKVSATLSSGETFEVEKVLVAVGRKLNSDNIGLEKAGVKTDGAKIAINEQCQTNVPHIYAIGDVAGRCLLAHVASREGMVAAEHGAGRDARMSYRTVPNCVYTEPGVGSVGLTEEQAKQTCQNIKVGRFPFRALGRALASGEVEGFVKVVSDGSTGEVLGVHMVGHMATELISEAAAAMQLEATVEDIATTIHAHPTYPEALMEASEDVLGHAIHLP